MWEGVGHRTELQHIDRHFYGHQRFFPVLLGCSTGGPEAQPPLGAGFLYRILFPTRLIPNCSVGVLRAPPAGCWISLPHLVSNWSGLQTNWLPVSPSYMIVKRPPSSCGRHKLHSFNPSTVKATLCYSSNGCTCYLHRCISYFDCLAGS